MATYLLQIDATDVNDYANQVNSEEAGASQFQNSSVSYHQNNITNIVTFLELPNGTVPATKFQLVNKGAPAPANTKQIWSGVVVLKSGLSPVVAYR
ncbi:MAG TPA: hypothetical protein VFE58_07365 [Tepidisphaeraceae bacterium]|jgi:hypothetical protein|nr:hypothetical protein [Tepidisphaeraceae bacterium]